MAQSDLYRALQRIPDARLPVAGLPGSRAAFFLRATPLPFTVLVAGSSNQDFSIRASQAVSASQVLLNSRRFAGSRPSGLQVDFDVAVAALAAVSAELVGSELLLSASIGGQAAVASSVALSKSFAAVVGATSVVVVDDLSGGSFVGELTLEPEVEAVETLTGEVADAQDLTPETGDSLTLTPVE